MYIETFIFQINNFSYNLISLFYAGKKMFYHKRLETDADVDEEDEAEVVQGQVSGLGLNRSYQRF